MAKRKTSFKQKYRKIPAKYFNKVRKMARSGKSWGWKRNYYGKFVKGETK